MTEPVAWLYVNKHLSDRQEVNLHRWTLNKPSADWTEVPLCPQSAVESLREAQREQREKSAAFARQLIEHLQTVLARASPQRDGKWITLNVRKEDYDAAVAIVPPCHCEACDPMVTKPGETFPSNLRMILCAICGNKRCPHATDHRNACTGSNKPGQPGSSYA